jgi:hypothetical protein
MRAYGNLTNRIAEMSRPAIPQVGMGATVLLWSDRHPATIITVKGNQVTLREDKAIRTDSNGMSESQQYRYEPDPLGKVFVASLRKNGLYVVKGESIRNGTIVSIGKRDAYHDFSF